MKIPSSTVLKAFRRRLTNLSSRNRSLLLTSLPAGQFLDLQETDFLLNKPSFTIISELISRKQTVAICEVLDARQERSNEVSRKLRRIDRATRFIEEERGTDDLYVGWPFVKGKFLDETVIHAPLLFFPVQIVQQGKFWKLSRRDDELAFLNPTLALAYGQFNQVKIPDEVIEKSMEDFDQDSLVFRTQLYEWLKSTPLEINFNQDLFTDKLVFFNKQTAKDLTQLERTGELKLYSEAVLGIFPQAGSFLVPDYDTLIEAGKSKEEETETDECNENVSDCSSLLFDDASSVSSVVSLPEKSIRTPLPMDASQEAALRAVKSGQSLVVQGPPGTGKSQLIANLMADAAASGKRVLLVCQKRAALDVVYERLRQVGVEPFIALIHDFQDDRRALYAQIANQINQIDTYRQENNSLNTVLIERDFDVESRRIDEILAELQTFKDTLFDTGECGLSAKELYLTRKSDAPIILLDDVYPQFHMGDVDNFVRRLTDFAAYQERLGPEHPWHGRISFVSFTNADLVKANQTITDWRQLYEFVKEQTTTLLGNPLSLDQLSDCLKHDWELTALLDLLDSPEADVIWKVVNQLRAETNHPALQTDEVRFEQLARAWEEILKSPGPEQTVATTDLRAFRELIGEASTARSSWLNWQWWQFTNAGKNQLAAVALANALPLTEAGLQTLAVKIDQRIRLESLLYEVKMFLTGLSLPVSPDSLRILRQAQHITERVSAIKPLRLLPEYNWQTAEQFTKAVKDVLELAARVERQKVNSSVYLNVEQLARIWSNEIVASSLTQSLRNDFDLMVEADRLQDSFSAEEATVIERLAGISPAQWAESFQSSLRQTWLNHIETAYPVLRSVSSLKMSQWEQVLQESILKKQSLSRDILLSKLREQTYRNLVLNRLNNVVSYRDLLHQTTKKRNVWPARKLMESFADEVFKLVPCWLASPESVSAMFPLREGLFDLVIFDEASQCFSESGIPAIVRGQQVVITGDSQQLRPSDLYRIRLDDVDQTEDTPVALEMESLLELAAQQLPQVSLTEHYRSRSLDLITFSNEHFYQNRLSLLPHFDTINQQEPAIHYLNVQGYWQQNTNPIEAEAVLDLVKHLQTDMPDCSIGIVTFNYQQQQLIQDMLENRASEESPITDKLIAMPNRPFVKNIENVQGDERDIIIFSVGYAPDERGRLSMQFGSLNTKGGENRLNVAITRARERIYVVTSLWPDQLNVDAAVNEGPKLLKAYLTYALSVAQKRFQPKHHLSQSLPSRVLLKDKLEALHSNLHPELPFADLTVKKRDTYESLVLTDDDLYYQQTPKQSHAYVPIALSTRKWPFERKWSRQYWKNQTD